MIGSPTPEDLNEPPRDLAGLLRQSQPLIQSLVQAEAGITLLRFDSVEDLVQGALQEAVKSAERLRWEGHEAFRLWLATITRRHLAARRDYWFACKRNHGDVLRLTLNGIAGDRAGPSTFAFRREQMIQVGKALTMLMPRDRDLATWASQGVSSAEMAERLGISEDAAEKARVRALERLRKAFFLLIQSTTPQSPQP